MNFAEKIRRLRSDGTIVLFAGLLLSFSMPFGKKFLPPFVVLFLISLFTVKGFGKIYLKGVSKLFLWVIISFYMLHVLGLLWTSNFDYAFTDLEIKLSLILFPLTFLFVPLNVINKRFLKLNLISFFLGCFISIIISAVIAYKLYMKYDDVGYFYYSTSSFFMHTSYISMYMIFAMFGMYMLQLRYSKLSGLFYIMALFMVFYLNIISSKAGFVTFALAILLVGIDIIIKRRWINILWYVFIPIVVFLISMFFFPASTARVITAVNAINTSKTEMKGSNESTSDRVLIWKAAFELTEDNMILGTGTGDIKDELTKTYKKNGMTYPAQLQLNAHNQFVQSFVALGIVGLLNLIAIIFMPLWISFRNKNILLFSFLFMFMFNILVESMLEVQAGIVYFTFWLTVLWMYKNNDSETKEVS